MIRVILFLACFVVGIFLVSSYLGPDDLSGCSPQPTNEEGCGAADVVVAVSGGDTVARTEEAIKLFQNGWAPKLVFSGAAEDKSGPSNAAVMKQIALAAGVPEEDILIDEHGQTTKQNAEETADLLDRHSVSSMILVTSAYHQRRTSLEFGQLFKNTEIRNHPVGNDKQWSGWWWLTPTGWYLAIGELVRIIMFYLGVTH
jgi:uncharacterized SAM-binding protein YcdF (DUF218 family)